MSILWNFDKYAKIEDLPFDPAYISSSYLTAVSADELLLKAGTPLKATSGVVAPLGQNDTPTCFANEDYHFILTNPQQPKMLKCVTKGYVEQAKVLAATGLESVPAGWADALAALGLFLVDDLGNLPGGSGGGSSGGGVFVATAAYENGAIVLDKTWAEIKNAINNKSPAFIYTSDNKFSEYSMYPILSVFYNDAINKYSVVATIGENTLTFTASSQDGHPTRVEA